ncbi:MAG: hypothetical protein WAN52_18320, partial [Pseudolabrys sp.]
PRWSSAGEYCVKFLVLTRKPADQIAVPKLHQAFLAREARSRLISVLHAAGVPSYASDLNGSSQ